MTDLGTLKLDTYVSGADWILGGASAINSAGQIIARGSHKTWSRRSSQRQ